MPACQGAPPPNGRGGLRLRVRIAPCSTPIALPRRGAGLMSTGRLRRRRYSTAVPELPSFSADNQFLLALGKAGGLCDCGNQQDDEASLGKDAAGVALLRAVRRARHHGQWSPSDPAARRHGRACATRGLPQVNLECLYGDRPGRASLPVPAARIRRSSCFRPWRAATSCGTTRARQSSAIPGMTRICSCHRCTSRSRGAAQRVRGPASVQMARAAADVFEEGCPRAALALPVDASSEEYLPLLIGTEKPHAPDRSR